jgi:hypothetical protein
MPHGGVQGSLGHPHGEGTDARAEQVQHPHGDLESSIDLSQHAGARNVGPVKLQGPDRMRRHQLESLPGHSR